MSGFSSAGSVPSTGATRSQLQESFRQGNYKDALDGLRSLALSRDADPKLVGNDLNMAVQCLQQLGRQDEIDGLLEEAVKLHQENWRLLWFAAQNYMSIPHHGFIVAGKFQRGDHRGGGKVVDATERDRVRALQLMARAMPMAMQDERHDEVGSFLFSLANMLLNNRGFHEAWRLQSLTDLNVLPDYEEGWYRYREPSGAPVDEAGNPVFYPVPRSFDAATNDGQRWRWCLAQAVEMNPQQRNPVRMILADFLRSQFGVQTLAEWGWRLGREQSDDGREDESGVYAVHTLGEGETIARLATGIKRFQLPDEFNYIKIYQQVAADSRSPQAITAMEHLAQIFENRRQYPKAASYWQRLLSGYPNAVRQQRLAWQRRLDQITGNWGRFEPNQTQPAGRGATLEYRFRNGKQVNFTVHEIKVDKLLEDVKTFLKSNPRQIDWRRIRIDDIGYRLVQENQRQYVGQQVAQWQLELAPREDHFDKRVTITTPLQKAGAYLLTANMAGGNTSFIVIWIDDTAIVRKPLDGKSYYFVADAVSGKPVAKANVEFFGWKQQYENNSRRHYVTTEQFAEYSDANGQVITDPQNQPQEMQWLVTARTREGRFAYLGFSGVWYGERYDADYNATKVYAITDRPVYRPDQKVKYKFWVRHAQYDMPEVSQFANQDFTVEIYSPKGEKIVSETKQTDAYGGIEGEYTIPADATLGVYQLQVKDLGGGSFRVEEYKKPEFEVTVDAPTEPVKLGDKITATIRAKYYFGSPVTKAKVKYKVTRTSQDDRWYPVQPWDWLYGAGYWWFSYDYTWYPGWRHWGCERPTAFWWPQRSSPPELVAEREMAIGPDGTVKVEIDTAAAKAVHPDQDHSYTITAEVVDQSRRTIVGTGNVLVARKPFSVYAWLDRGYYRTGDTVAAHFAARTPDGKPVQGKGELRLLKITYKDGKPKETVVQTWSLDTNAEGVAVQQITASQAGQYRLSYRVQGAGFRGEGSGSGSGKIQDPQSIEGGYVFTIVGEGFDGSQFRFNHLELIPDKREYAPGETVKLQINTDRVGSTVLLFARPANGIYLPPKLIRMDGKSTVEEIGVVQKDIPNFFVEAVTIADGRVYTEAKEIIVPPEKRVLNVEVRPSKEAYKPGEKAQAKIKLTDIHGRPFVGSTVVAIYDKSLEYLAGGSNVPEIKEFFWKWRRQHHPRTETSLERWFGNMVKPRSIGMSDLGVYGRIVKNDSAGPAENFSFVVGFDRGGAVKSQGRGARPFSLLAAPAAAPGEAFATEKMSDADVAAAQQPAAAIVQPTIRTKFADTALWVGALTTDKDGLADVSLTMPENLTTWRIKVWGMGHGTKVGQGQTDVVTRKDLIIRLEAPRFFVQTDEVVLSAIVHNYLKTKKSVQVALELDGKCLEVIAEGDKLSPKPGHPVMLNTGKSYNRPIEVEANGEARVDWRVKVLDEGEAVIRMKALTDEESDAMEQRFPCYIHGMLKTDSYSGSIRPNDTSGRFTISVPEQRRPEQSLLEVRFSPTLAGAMVDALPYMVDYPYGCTEQTLNRFLPTVITQKVLLDMKLDLKEIQRKQTNLDSQAWDKGSGFGLQGQRAAAGGRKKNPVFDEDEVRRMVKEGVARLTEMQCADGGWGWFSGYGEYSSPHTTAVVVHGLQIARQNDVALVPGVLERGVEWLTRYQNEQVQLLKNAAIKEKPDHLRWKAAADNLDALVSMVLADAGVSNAEMREFLYRDRTHLSVYGLTVFGIALEKQGEQEKLAMVLRNIGQYVEQDDENQTAWLRLPQQGWWYWYGSEFEAEAYYLKLLARTDPKGELARRLVKYLLNNRKHATYWNSTRDTALCIEAFADFLRRSGEDRPEMTVEVYFDGKLQKAVEITPQTLFQFDNKFVVEGRDLSAGQHTVELKKKGNGPLYFNGYATNFTLEEFIKRAGLEIKVNRKYYKLVQLDKTTQVAGSRGQVVDQKVEKYERQELPNLAQLKSGDLVEIELEIDSKNDYEYLVFEDMKPAGFEPVDLRSGYTGNELGAYVEFRDNRVVFFARQIARGKHSVSYRMRAEVPGKFSALPTRGSAMYAPELKANSDELKLRVED